LSTAVPMADAPGRNNCAACDHKKHPDGGHCYMFRTEPEGVCMKHTARTSGVPVVQSVKCGRCNRMVDYECVTHAESLECRAPTFAAGVMGTQGDKA
jgi:hypothetical protein